MDHAQYNPAMMPLLLKSNVLDGDFFTLLDVGCSGGLDPLWRLFGERLRAVGADPQRGECRRLQRAETNPHVNYVPCFIGLPRNHPYHTLARQQGDVAPGYLRESDHRDSSAYARRLTQAIKTQSNSLGDDLAQEKMSIADLARQTGLDDIDFIKTDTDGSDLEAVLSGEETIRRCGVLGFMIEAPFVGSGADAENSFHNIDRFMKRQGFALYGLTIHRYSRRDLPARFVYPILAQTEFGQVIWGDAVYLRDGASAHYREFWGEELSLTKLAKLACLYELFRLPDCAAELIVAHRSRFAPVVDPEPLLDALVPPLRDQRYSYDEYMRWFHEDLGQFLPAEPPSPKKTWRRVLAGGIRKALRALLT